MNMPTKSTEVAFEQLTGDMDELLQRIELFSVRMEETGEKLAFLTARLQEAGSRYGQAVSEFTEEAKTELSDYLENRTKALASKQAALVHEMVLENMKTGSDTMPLPCSGSVRKTRAERIAAHAATALCTSILTSLLTHFACPF